MSLKLSDKVCIVSGPYYSTFKNRTGILIERHGVDQLWKVLFTDDIKSPATHCWVMTGEIEHTDR